MRVTTHNSRKNRQGQVYTPRHNDRHFDISHADHIDPERTGQNFYWNYYTEKKGNMSFEDAEKKFYDDMFSAGLQAKNGRYQRQRHPERMQTIDDLRTNPKTCPEETLYYLGSIREGAADPQVLLEVYKQFLQWHDDMFPAVKTIDYALHVDEQGAPHIHARSVYIGHDADGNAIPNQSRALQEMGVDRPHPDRPQSRYNNPKQTYTQICREKIRQIARAHGLEIETQPREPGKSGKTMMQYQAEQERQKLSNLRRQTRRQSRKLAAGERDLQETERRLQAAREQLAETERKLAKQNIYLKGKKSVLADLNTAAENLENLINGDRRILAANQRREQAARDRLERLEDEYER